MITHERQDQELAGTDKGFLSGSLLGGEVGVLETLGFKLLCVFLIVSRQMVP